MRTPSLLAIITLMCACATAQDLSKRPPSAGVTPPSAAEATFAPNSNAVYQKLRNTGLSGEAVALNSYTFKRDAATFTLTGTVSFLQPVEGRVTGAVFTGQGTMTLVPPIEVEKRNVAILTKEGKVTEEFGEMVMRFSDGAYDELKKAGASAGAGSDGPLRATDGWLRTKLKYNVTARLLMDVLNSKAPGMFLAVINGKKYSGHWVFAVDPEGSAISATMAPEEVMLQIPEWNDNNFGTWASFHLSDEYASGKAYAVHPRVIDVEDENIDAAIEKNARLRGVTATKFKANQDGLRVVPFDLFPRLRVSSVTDAAGHALEFIQEDRDEDAQFAVILPKALAAGEEFTVKTTYEGPDAVKNEGGGNYYPVARENWYPASGDFGDMATFEMRLSIPKGLTMSASANKVSDENEGGKNVTEWKSKGEQTVACFEFGKVRRQEAKLKSGFGIEAYANEKEPDVVKGLQHAVMDIPGSTDPNAPAPGRPGAPVAGVAGATLDNMTTVGMMSRAVAEAQASIALYTDYFGTLPFDHVAMTQQTAGNFGQSWPSLVWLPITYFYDTTIRNQLGMGKASGYFKVVGPHEVAHQWWGHTVTWNSYRDQWMSEGFSDFSASLFLQTFRSAKDYREFWRDEHRMIVEKNRYGYRPNDIGPLTLGYRLTNHRSGEDATRYLIYPKGAFILQMVRSLMWRPQDGDARFKEMMQDFVKSYRGKPASTEAFKAVVERHMTPELDMDGNRKMDWFFNEYVYGTQLPNYTFRYTLSSEGSGQVLNVELKQSGVDPNFKMRVPLYLELSNGKIVRLGTAPMTGDAEFKQTIPLSGMKEKVKSALLNYNYDVLATVDGQ